MEHRTFKLGALSIIVWLALAACGGGTSTSGTNQGNKAAGADKTKITDWTDPRPASWSSKYPLFAPVKVGDGSLQRVQNAGQLSICAETDLKPDVYLDPQTNQVVGVEVDMAKWVATYLGIRSVSYVNIPFASLIPALQAHKCDIVWSSISLKSVRAEAPGVKYTVPYLWAAYDVLTVRADSGISSFADLKGKALGTLAGSTDESTAQSEIASIGGNVTLRSFAGASECFLATNNKTTAGCFIAEDVTLFALAQYPQLKELAMKYPYLAPDPVAEKAANPYVFAAVAVIASSADSDLNLALSIGLTDMRTSGEEASLLTKWNLAYQIPKDNLVRPDA